MTEAKTYTTSEILSRVCSHFSVVPDDFISIGKDNMLFIRQVYIYCLWRFTEMSHMEIGIETFRSSLSVRETLEQINETCKTDLEFRNKIIEVESLFE